MYSMFYDRQILRAKENSRTEKCSIWLWRIKQIIKPKGANSISQIPNYKIDLNYEMQTGSNKTFGLMDNRP